jgi:hypothetical protein
MRSIDGGSSERHPSLCCAAVCAPRSLCSRKNAHIRLVASILLLVGPTHHSGSGLPPGHEWPPPLDGMEHHGGAFCTVRVFQARDVRSDRRLDGTGRAPVSLRPVRHKVPYGGKDRLDGVERIAEWPAVIGHHRVKFP